MDVRPGMTGPYEGTPCKSRSSYLEIPAAIADRGNDEHNRFNHVEYFRRLGRNHGAVFDSETYDDGFANPAE
jgi:hypothetical protein